MVEGITTRESPSLLRPSRQPLLASRAAFPQCASILTFLCAPCLCQRSAGKQLLQQMGKLIPKLKSRVEGKKPVPGAVPGLPFPGYPETLLPVALPPPVDGAVASGSGGGGSSKKKKAK